MFSLHPWLYTITAVISSGSRIEMRRNGASIAENSQTARRAYIDEPKTQKNIFNNSVKYIHVGNGTFSEPLLKVSL